VIASTSLDYEDISGSGGWDKLRELTVQVDPYSNTHVNSLQVGATGGVNVVPNGLEGGVIGGVSVTEGFNIISGWDSWYWPWNWWR
jgi:hypothetical protein